MSTSVSIWPNVTPVQTYVAVPAYNSADTSGAGGTNATIVNVLAAAQPRASFEIINNGANDVELWFGAKPTAGQVGQTIKQGRVVKGNGGGLFRDAKTEEGDVWATAQAATGLSVIMGA